MVFLGAPSAKKAMYPKTRLPGVVRQWTKNERRGALFGEVTADSKGTGWQRRAIHSRLEGLCTANGITVRGPEQNERRGATGLRKGNITPNGQN